MCCTLNQKHRTHRQKADDRKCLVSHLVLEVVWACIVSLGRGVAEEGGRDGAFKKRMDRAGDNNNDG